MGKESLKQRPAILREERSDAGWTKRPSHDLPLWTSFARQGVARAEGL